jgi:hypothetical protein
MILTTLSCARSGLSMQLLSSVVQRAQRPCGLFPVNDFDQPEAGLYCCRFYSDCGLPPVDIELTLSTVYLCPDSEQGLAEGRISYRAYRMQSQAVLCFRQC